MKDEELLRLTESIKKSDLDLEQVTAQRKKILDDLAIKIYGFGCLTKNQEIQNISLGKNTKDIDPEIRKKTIKSHLRALDALSKINIVLEKLENYDAAINMGKSEVSLSEKEDKKNQDVIQESIDRLNEAKTTLITSYQNIDFFDNTLTDIIQQMPSLWPKGEVHDDRFEEIQKKHQYYNQLKMRLNPKVDTPLAELKNFLSEPENEFSTITKKEILQQFFPVQYKTLYEKYLPLAVRETYQQIDQAAKKCSDSIAKALSEPSFKDTGINNSMPLFHNSQPKFDSDLCLLGERLKKIEIDVQDFIGTTEIILKNFDQLIAVLKPEEITGQLPCLMRLPAYIREQKMTLFDTIQSTLQTLLKVKFKQLDRYLSLEGEKTLSDIKTSFENLEKVLDVLDDTPISPEEIKNKTNTLLVLGQKNNRANVKREIFDTLNLKATATPTLFSSQKNGLKLTRKQLLINNQVRFMMKNEKKLIKAIKENNVDKVNEFTEGISKSVLATFININQYSLWCNIQSEKMVQILLSWNKTPKGFTSLKREKNILLDLNIPLKTKFLLLKNVVPSSNATNIYFSLLSDMISSDTYHQDDESFLAVFKLILDRDKDVFNMNSDTANRIHNTYVIKFTLLQLAYFHECVPAIEILLQHIPVEEVIKQLDAPVYTWIPPVITCMPIDSYTFADYRSSYQNIWHIQLDEFREGNRKYKAMGYFKGEKQQGPSMVVPTNSLFADPDFPNYNTIYHPETKRECQNLLNRLIIGLFIKKGGISAKLSEVLSSSPLLTFPSVATKADIISFLGKQLLTTETLEKINILLSNILSSDKYHEKDLNLFLPALKQLLNDLPDKMKESNSGKDEAFYAELSALISQLETAATLSKAFNTKSILLQHNILKLHTLTQKIEQLSSVQNEENIDSEKREKAVSSHTEILAVLSTINILRAEMKAENQTELPAYTNMLNEAKTRILESYQDMDFFDPTLTKIIKNMSHLWPAGNVHDDKFKEIQEQHLRCHRFQGYLKADMFIRAETYLKNELELQYKKVCSENGLYLSIEADTYFKMQYKKICKTYALYLSLAYQKINTLTEKSNETIKQILTQDTFKIILKNKFKILCGLKNKFEILSDIMKEINTSIQEWIDAEKTVLTTLIQETANDLGLNTEERLQYHKMLTSYIHPQKLKLFQTVLSCLKTVLLSRDFTALLKPFLELSSENNESAHDNAPASQQFWKNQFHENKEELKAILKQIKDSFDALTISLCESDYTLALLDEMPNKALKMNTIYVKYVKQEINQSLSYTYRIDENDESLVKTGSVHFEIEGELTADMLAHLNQKDLIEDITHTRSNFEQEQHLEKEKGEILAILDLKQLPPSALPAQTMRVPDSLKPPVAFLKHPVPLSSSCKKSLVLSRVGLWEMKSFPLPERSRANDEHTPYPLK